MTKIHVLIYLALIYFMLKAGKNKLRNSFLFFFTSVWQPKLNLLKHLFSGKVMMLKIKADVNK